VAHTFYHTGPIVLRVLGPFLSFSPLLLPIIFL